MSDSYATEVQAELQQYLNSKNINSLFISIVENLLIEKPHNPIAFMIEYLFKTYPDQAQVALGNVAPKLSSKGKSPRTIDTSSPRKKDEESSPREM